MSTFTAALDRGAQKRKTDAASNAVIREMMREMARGVICGVMPEDARERIDDLIEGTRRRRA
jgi:hypothetical protein